MQQYLRRLIRIKSTIYLWFFCVYLMFIIMLLRSSEYHLYSQQILQNDSEINKIDSTRNVPLTQSFNVQYKVKKTKKTMPEIKPRIIQAAEAGLFRKKNSDFILSLQENFLADWKDKYCFGNLYNFNESIILMKNVIIDPLKKQSVAQGGEEIQSVIGHSEKDEDVEVHKGFFTLQCNDLPKIKFATRSHHINWFSGISVSIRSIQTHTPKSPFTVLIKRRDYANLYWTLIELFNTYLTIRLLKENPKTTDVILMDAHPVGKLDKLWKIIFGNVYRIGQMSNKIFINKLAWVMINGPMVQNVQNIPFLEEFKLSLYQGVYNSPSLYHTCSGSLNVTFILRKDYIAHPRNPSGKIQRKIANEKQVIEYLKNNLSDVNINAIQIDKLSIEEQIKLIYETNIFIGVHGAGLGHTLLLRSGSSIIELFPASYKRSPNPHFHQFAYWADIQYDRWYSTDPVKSNNEWIYIPPEVPFNLIKHAKKRFC